MKRYWRLIGLGLLVISALVLFVPFMAHAQYLYFNAWRAYDDKPPMWNIYQGGAAIQWVTWVSNPRFAVTNPRNASDDIVLDKATGLVWERLPQSVTLGQLEWSDSIEACTRTEHQGVMGWRLPTVEELSTLYELQGSKRDLPYGHPFVQVGDKFYWTSSTRIGYASQAYTVRFGFSVYTYLKTSYQDYWCVRGGTGPTPGC
ncbi:MAG TPA: DUF1566 domain-containing protein [Syntrophales bacterium]|nr:DUF1566 domain-containing protein [Syntrophales bacterium]